MVPPRAPSSRGALGRSAAPAGQSPAPPASGSLSRPGNGNNQEVSFRRSKADAADDRRWRQFLDSERDLFRESGLPGAVVERAVFDDVLMHAFLPMPGGLADGTRFDVDELSAGQREVLRRLVERYLEEFEDPGVDVTLRG